MHIDDGACTEVLTAEVEEGKEATSMVSMPVGYHHTFYRRKRYAKTGKIARKRLRFGTCVKEREARSRVWDVMRFLLAELFVI